MHYRSRGIISFIVFLLVFILFYGATLGLYFIFLFPFLAISLYLSFYLYKQTQKDNEERIKKGIHYAVEDIEAEKWIKTSFAPEALIYIKTKKWTFILYSFLFVSVASFIWGYIDKGLSTSIRNFTYAGVVFWFSVLYVFIASIAFSHLLKFLPKTMKRFFGNDWGRGYIFLFPITYLVYVIFPYETTQAQLLGKLSSLPLFLTIYTFSFLCLYCVVYMYRDIQDEEEKILKRNVKKLLDDFKEEA